MTATRSAPPPRKINLPPDASKRCGAPGARPPPGAQGGAEVGTEAGTEADIAADRGADHVADIDAGPEAETPSESHPPRPPGGAAADTHPGGYATTLHGGFRAVAASAQEIHAAIADKVFGSVLRVPGLAVPARLAQAAHDSITLGVYGVVRGSAHAAFGLAGRVERLARDPSKTPGAAEQALRSALNAVVGDALQSSANPMAVTMQLRTGAAPLGVTPAALADLGPRVCVFIHGLGCDESSWWRKPEAWSGTPEQGRSPRDVSNPLAAAGTAGSPGSSGPTGSPGPSAASASGDSPGAAPPLHYATLLEREAGIQSVYVRYNTGLSLDANGALLAALLERAAAAAPQVAEWLLIGHSMGGLVARRAHQIAALEQLAWSRRTPMLVCLGAPHHGAPLERIGRLAAAVLQVSAVTRPLGRLADARSQGIRDLRRGLNGRPRASATVTTPALRFVAATLSGDPGSHVGKAWGESIGDGLVPIGSAVDDGASGDVQRVVLAGLGHMDLLNHPRVWAALRGWIVGR